MGNNITGAYLVVYMYLLVNIDGNTHTLHACVYFINQPSHFFTPPCMYVYVPFPRSLIITPLPSLKPVDYVLTYILDC